MMKKGDRLRVVDRKDGRHYDCKVVKRRNGRVLIHFVGWSKSHEEWLSIGDPRIMQPTGEANTNRARSEDPDTLQVSRVSAEVLIDETHDRLFNSQPSLHTQQILSTPISPTGNRKRVRDPDSTGSGDMNVRKRGAYADATRTGLVDDSSSPHYSRASARVPALMTDEVEEQRRLSATLLPATLGPPEANVSSAESGGEMDGG